MKSAAAVVAVLALFTLAGRAEATPVLTTNPALFAGQDPTFIDFEDLIAPTAITTQYAADGVVFSGGLHTDTVIPTLIAGGTFGSIAATNGDPGCCPDVTMTFGGGAARLGFDIITRGGAVTTLDIYTGFGGSLSLLGSLTLSASLEPHFFGVAADVSDPTAFFNTVVISTRLSGDPSGFVIDNVRFTNAVPEPSSLVLVGIGTAAMVRRLRRRRSRQG